MTHEKVDLKLKDGITVQAIAPVILSASRATDLPAFFHTWFNNRLNDGYSVWYNPYSKQPQYISYEKVKGIVFWSKDPNESFIGWTLLKVKSLGIDFYLQYTLNDYESEGFEPELPPLTTRINKFKQISEKYGKDSVIWRFDPLILTKHTDIDELTSRIEFIGDQLKGYTNKLVFSFIDINTYKSVQNKLIKETSYFTRDCILNSEFSPELMEKMAANIANLRDKWKSEGWDLTLATCGEKFDLDKYDIQHNKCVDSEQFKKITHNEEFIKWLDENGGQKDKGQRLTCGCMLSKDIGAYNTCKHFCAYCYANVSRDMVNSKLMFYNSATPWLIHEE